MKNRRFLTGQSKSLRRPALAAGLILSLFATAGASEAGADLDGLKLSETETAFEAPLADVAALSNAVGHEDGEPTMYYTVAGDPALFHVVGLHDYRLKATYPLPGAERSWAHAVAPDSSVYIGGVGSDGGSARLYRYRPGSDEVEDLGVPVRIHKFIWEIVSDDEGNIYGGTWEGGHVFRYDPEKDAFTDYGKIQENEDYVRSIVWHDGYIYAGTGVQNGRVWELDPETGERRKIEIPVRPEYEDRIDQMGSVYHLQTAGDYLFVRFSIGRLVLVYDIARGEWWDEMYDDARGLYSGFASQDVETFFLYTTGGVRRIDLDTRETREMMGPGAIFRGGGWIELADGSGSAFATTTFNGSVSLVDPDRGFSKSLGSVATSQPAPVQSLETGPKGILYLSGYMGTKAARVDPSDGSVDLFSMGQAEGIGFFDGRIYWGEYPHAEIQSSPLENPGDIRTDFHVGEDQDRPFAITSSEDRIFFGTIPGYGHLGGALTVFDPSADGDARIRTFRNIVPDQSIVSVDYHDGRIYGSTSIHGGLGVEPTETAGKVFIWDIEEETVLAVKELDLPDAGQMKMVGGVSVGPDGLLYGTVNGTLFALDPETLDVVRHRNLYPDVTSYGRWRPVHLRWDDDGLLYTNIGGRITVVEPKTFDFRDTGARSGLMTLGQDGFIYYVDNPDIMRIEVSHP